MASFDIDVKAALIALTAEVSQDLTHLEAEILLKRDPHSLWSVADTIVMKYADEHDILFLEASKRLARVVCRHVSWKICKEAINAPMVEHLLEKEWLCREI